ncbi:hypothetical protein [Salinicola avicenniae]|uniref:hypothetical protein n=1 Tax=Salinicola avicenniae TaxID=2916836 RepID=UPI00207367FB|nr:MULTISPECIES: hypothetical protein [unclassified Salinicola]
MTGQHRQRNMSALATSPVAVIVKEPFMSPIATPLPVRALLRLMLILSPEVAAC